MTSGISRGQKFYLDTNVVIAAVEDDSAAGRAIWASLQRGAKMGRNFRDPIERFVTSELTLAECLVKPLRDGDEELASVYAMLLVNNDLVAMESVHQDALWIAAYLRGQHTALKLPDAIHIATAFCCGCSFFLTGDTRLHKDYWARPLDALGRPIAGEHDRRLQGMHPEAFGEELGKLEPYDSDE
ncbi:type II toxin-antitoxin system VapC family toxin [Acuticoccus kandeliae]|uniref:type II toxin-antitoxin system VapC family toxin n=1 Tax=Acuticoccus kandeliae TaxID=2073160 RepID=UPI002481B465|nr:type II toxin-antitoxin system VapC family toxin [Acuticoccus kandeliae]